MSTLPTRPFPIGPRGGLALLVLLGALAAAIGLGLTPAGLLPRESGWRVAGEFFRAALQPAIDYEAEWVPPGAPPFLWSVVLATLSSPGFVSGLFIFIFL